MGKVYIYSYGHNCQDYIEQHFNNIRNQDYKDYTHIVINDASTDDTQQMLEDYKDDNTEIYNNNNKSGWLCSFFAYVVPVVEMDDIVIFIDVTDKLADDVTLLSEYIDNIQQSKIQLGYSNCYYINGGDLNVDMPYNPLVINRCTHETATFKFYGLRSIKGKLLHAINPSYFHNQDMAFPMTGHELVFFLSYLKLIDNTELFYNPKPLLFRNRSQSEQVVTEMRDLPNDRKSIEIRYRRKIYDAAIYERVAVGDQNTRDIIENTEYHISSSTNMKEYILSLWDGFDEQVIDNVLNNKTPMASIAMVSWLRVPKLLLTLEHTLKTTTIPINFCIHLQGYEKLNKQDEVKIESLLSKFSNFRIKKTDTNIGTGIPRHGVVHTALDEFPADYVLTLDDDTLLPYGGIEIEVIALEMFKQYGYIGLNCLPHERAYKFTKVSKKGLERGARPDSSLMHVIPTRYSGLCTIDAYGSATTMIRRQVFETCDLDTQYQVGYADYDFAMQLHKHGWKKGIICANEIKAVNNYKKNPIEYKGDRSNKEVIKKSKSRFLYKWNVSGV